MRTRLIASLAVSLSLLGACSSDSDTGSESAAAASVDPATLCVSSDCGSKTALLTIPDAENLLFSSSGRLFVSGGLNVYEVVKAGEGFEARPLYDGECNFTGLAIVNGVLYANCFDGQLYAATLTDTPSLQPIHDLGLAAPNGLVDGPDGELYLVNGPLATTALPNPKIVRLRLNPDDPFEVIEQTDWFSAGLLGPNGLQRRGHSLLVSNTKLTALGEILEVPILAGGSAGEATQLTAFSSLPDDFSVVGDYLLAAWYLSGQVALIDPDGNTVQKTDRNSFAFPSQVRSGQSPLFKPTDLLITEKGILGETGSNYGNVLSLFRPKSAD